MNSRVSCLSFSKDSLDDLKAGSMGNSWPIVYVLENKKEAYIGETTHAARRLAKHLEDERRKDFKKLYLIKDEKFNKSATLDIEAKLIEYIAGDGCYTLQNSNRGLRNHNYYNRQLYKSIFNEIWDELVSLKVAKHSIRDIENSELFKYSPFKTLTDEQAEIVDLLENTFLRKHKEGSTSIIQGEPGSGKTILAVYLIKYLLSGDKTKSFKVGLVLPQTSLRSTVQKIFKSIEGLKVNMAIGPNDVVKKDKPFDVLIVDEAHRLTQRRNLANYSTFDAACKKLRLDPLKSNQLEWILKQSKHTVILYDSNQSVKPSDVDQKVFSKLFVQSDIYHLKSQMRVLAGDKYTSYIEGVLKGTIKIPYNFEGYNLYLFSDLNAMVRKIKQLDAQYGLCRLAAGFAWEWISRNDPKKYDIVIKNCKLRWNATTKNWINNPGAVNEVGCIHTVQGYDLNYAGVIIGPELSYINGRLQFHLEKYKDKYGKHSSKSPEDMVEYIINIYKTLMTRGIKGTFVYACDENLMNYLSKFIPLQQKQYLDEVADKDGEFGIDNS